MTTVITDREVPALALYTRLAPHQVDEIRAFVDAIDGDHRDVMTVEYDVVDCPLIRVTRRMVDEEGRTLANPQTGEIATTTVERPLTVPLPDWWRP